ncbi:MAG TPA: SUMF1/EgtB/PvdO family nonheme iron enzyme [Terriglobales bacterium]|jgi:iron(II)-dependent oxidoreductase|nr:SUMF1/EgtB/PvdO family nonheme iron enzyme [Terriglobales bacterium]
MPVAEQAIGVPTQLIERFTDAQVRTDEIFDIVRPDSLYERPIPERHRIIFYLGHLEAFDWNLLRERVLGLKAFDPDLDNLFAFGIDPVDGALPSDQPRDWPSAADARGYVKRIRESIDAALATLKPGDWNSNPVGTDFTANILLNVAIEHRLMHAETLAYMLHQLPLERKLRIQRKPELIAPPIEPEMIQIPAGRTTLGLPRRDPKAFGWDNEYEAQSVDVEAFTIDKYKVTNQQYLDFVAAGGYENRAFWTDEDWNWRTSQNIQHPVFWSWNNGRWFYRTMLDEISLPPDWPVYVSHAEASAYARWAGKSLPTEAQWHRAAYGTVSDTERLFPWGSAVPDASKGNFDFHSWDPTPVGAFPEGQSAFGVTDLLGNGWEWTSSRFEPFPGFHPFSFYPGYSANFFDGKHYVMKGASARTAACMLRRSFRNWFQPHYQYVYAGFRCVGT